jgi:aspartate kinase
MKFGGTSLGDAERIVAVSEIVRQRLHLGPVVVLSAMAGATDLLGEAVSAARRGKRDAVETAVGELAKRHRWAVSGTMQDSLRRHDLDLEVDAIFEELRVLLRSVRVLGEGTPRAADTLLAFGELLSTRIATAVFVERGIRACWIDPREIVVTDDRHGAAEPDMTAVTERCRSRLLPVVEQGEVPVMGGFVGATPQGDTTTLGRGGGDTSAAIVGSALGVQEIQIWTDVDGLMTADPRAVPAARRLSKISFPEAADLAYYGARVLHPASVAPAVEQNIPVRILNSMNPDGPGTAIVDRTEVSARGLASVTSRRGLHALRVIGRGKRLDPEFLSAVVKTLERCGVSDELAVASQATVTVVAGGEPQTARIAAQLPQGCHVESVPDLAVVCVVGGGLADDGDLRRRVLEVLAAHEPLVVALGVKSTSVAAVVADSRLEGAVRDVHRRFFE